MHISSFLSFLYFCYIFSGTKQAPNATHQSKSFPKNKVPLPSEGNIISNFEPSFNLCRFKSLLVSNSKYSRLFLLGHDLPCTFPFLEAHSALASSENLCMSFDESVSPAEPSTSSQATTTNSTARFSM